MNELIGRIERFKKDVYMQLQVTNELRNQIGMSKGGRELSIVVTKLQETLMWIDQMIFILKDDE
jgi:hypothetical protein